MIVLKKYRFTMKPEPRVRGNLARGMVLENAINREDIPLPSKRLGARATLLKSVQHINQLAKPSVIVPVETEGNAR